MAHYLVQVGYTPEAWAAMIQSPQNRQEKVAPAVESLGGKFLHSWMAFGEYDLIGIVDLPDNIDAAAFAIGVCAKGAVRSFKTTPLIGMNESIEAMRRAQKMTYAPPTRVPAGIG